MPTRPRRRTSRAVAALVATLLTLPLLPGSAGADPSKPTLEAKKELARLVTEISMATEDYDEAQIHLATAERDAARAQGRVAQKERELASLREGMSSLASAAYRSGGGTEPLLLVLSTGSPETFLDQVGTVNAITRNQADRLRDLRALRRSLEHEQAVAREKVAAADRIAAGMERTKERITAAIARQEALVARLESADARRERLEREAAERRAAQLAARAAAARAAARAEAARQAALRASRSRVSTPPPSYSGPASGRAQIAVAEAYRQLGKPYQWGAEGPDRFDCSGLTMWVWAKAGVSLPHSSRMQFNEGRRVAQSELQPGDLVFYGSPIHHVGIYVGDGKKIAAPQTGDVVKISTVYRDDYTGAVRL